MAAWMRDSGERSSCEMSCSRRSRASPVSGTTSPVRNPATARSTRVGTSIHSIAAALLRGGDCLVAISQRGNSPALVRSVKLARRGGADVVVLAPSGTPLADLATVLIPIDLVFNTDPYTPISARLAYLVVIDVLAVGLALQRGPEFRKKMQNAQKALQEFDMQFDSFIG